VVSLASEWGIIGNLAGQDFPVDRFLPHRVKGEGFFWAVLRKSRCHFCMLFLVFVVRMTKSKITKKKRKGAKGGFPI